jgi:hypothetical protein
MRISHQIALIVALANLAEAREDVVVLVEDERHTLPSKDLLASAIKVSPPVYAKDRPKRDKRADLARQRAHSRRPLK